jgi:hypothetical protein
LPGSNRRTKGRGHAKLQEFHGKGRELAPVELELRQILYATNFTDFGE